MTFRLNLDPQLPQEQEPFIRRLRELWMRAAQVTRELQAPPAMHVRKTTTQALTAATVAKVEFNSTRYDTHGWWDGTNYRWFPKRAGYYNINWSVGFEAGASANAVCYATLYIDGNSDRVGTVINPTTTTSVIANNSALLYADGSTRYFEVFALCSQNTNILGDQMYTYFCAHYLGDDQLR